MGQAPIETLFSHYEDMMTADETIRKSSRLLSSGKSPLSTLMLALALIVLVTTPGYALNEAEILQEGTSNQGNIVQYWGSGWGHDMSIVDELNRAQLTQQGQANLAQITQAGIGNQSSVNQIGRLHQAGFYQLGSGNELSLYQSGYKNRAQAQQVGDLNSGALMQYGNYNQIIVNQFGTANNYHLTQTGDGNFATVTQTSY